MPNPKAWEVEQKIIFTREVPGQAFKVGASWCYPGSYPVSDFMLFIKNLILSQSLSMLKIKFHSATAYLFQTCH